MSFVRKLPTLCGIGLYGKNAWVRYGGYTWLHRPIPMYWPADEAALTASAAAFDTLFYDSVPPPQFGFKPVRCFGEVCVARRPGRCEARPAPPMWFPEHLRGMAPPKERFQAIPQSARPSEAAQARPGGTACRGDREDPPRLRSRPQRPLPIGSTARRDAVQPPSVDPLPTLNGRSEPTGFAMSRW